MTRYIYIDVLPMRNCDLISIAVLNSQRVITSLICQAQDPPCVQHSSPLTAPQRPQPIARPHAHPHVRLHAANRSPIPEIDKGGRAKSYLGYAHKSHKAHRKSCYDSYLLDILFMACLFPSKMRSVMRSTTRSAAPKAVFSIQRCSKWCFAVWNSSPGF